MPTLTDRFRAKAEACGTEVRTAPDEAAAATLVAEAGLETACTRSLAATFPRVAARCTPTPALPAAAADVVAAALFAVAETGSLVVREATAADRSACWLAERLWLLVPASAVEATLDAALGRIAALAGEGAPYVTLMSGPSRTADIERILTIGVHGPRELRVVLVGGGAA